MPIRKMPWLQLLIAVVLTGAVADAQVGGTNASDRASHRVRIVLVGDSTMAQSSGWGPGFAQFLAPGAECINTARGGRSSMSFMKEGLWTNALALKADYYLVQFGHNNQPGKPGRSTDMPTFVSDMKQYVDEARAIGAKPVLVTPLTRRQWDKSGNGKIDSTLEPYAAEVRKIAAAKHVPLVDLHARSVELCEKLGPHACVSFSPVKVVDGTSAVDGTHLNPRGSVLFARLVVEELRKAVPELAPCFRSEPVDVIGSMNPAAVVAADGLGSFTNVQAAVHAAPSGLASPYSILIKPGIYRGHIDIPTNKPFLTLIGERGGQPVVLTDDHNIYALGADGRKLSTGDSATVLVQASNFTAENITFENTAGNHGQALAMYVMADRARFGDCRFLGWQDTLRPDSPRGELGRQYFTNCEIVGHVDFIYAAGTAVFDHCHIHCLADGYITAASTPQDHAFGFVFINCRITAEPGAKVYLGRPWRPYAATAFLNTEMPEQIRPEGWNNWRNPQNEQTARYGEYKNSGPGARAEARVPWARQLTDDEAKRYTVANVLGGPDGWDPTKN